MTTSFQLEDKALMLQRHPCIQGLSAEAVAEIAGAGEIVRYAPGDCLHRANEVTTSLFLVIQGRASMSLFDVHGKVIMRRSLTSGQQFGLLSAAVAEPSPVECTVEDPTMVFRLEYVRARQLIRKHADFGLNLTQSLSGSLKNILFSNRIPKPPPLVAMFHESAETRVLTPRLLQRLTALGEQLGLLSDLPDWAPVDGVAHRCIVEDHRPAPMEDIRRLVTDWMSSRQVFGDLGTAVDPSLGVSALEFCNVMLWCVTPGNHEASVARLREFIAHAPGLGDKITIVWLLGEGEDAPAAPELRALAGHDLKLTFAEPGPGQNRMAINGFERLVHLVRGIRIGIALGGGSARGMAHLGVLKVLEQHGIVFDMIAGTSAGAMVGTVYASGMDAERAAAQFAHDLTPPWFLRRFKSGEQWNLLYKYRRRRFDPMLRKYLADLRLEQLPVPMSTVTLDLISGTGVIRDAGDAVDGIIESINLPVLSPPIKREGQSLVDGGLIDNIPADVLVNKGCNFVIAVSVTATFEHEFATNRPSTPLHEMKTAGIVETILRTHLVQSANLNSIGVEPANVVIEPDVTGYALSEFTRAREVAEIGEQAALDAMPEIKRALARLDPRLFANV